MLLLVFLALAVAPAQTIETAETLLRAAAYDKNLEARTPEGLRLGVIFDPAVAESKASAENFVKKATALDSEFAPAWIELVAFQSESRLYDWEKDHHVSVLFVPSGMDKRLASIVRACEAAGVLTLADSFADVEQGLSQTGESLVAFFERVASLLSIGRAEHGRLRVDSVNDFDRHC